MKSTSFVFRLLVLISPLLFCPHSASAQTGDVTGIHDPSVIQAGDKFYLFCTGWGITERTSDDLFQWKRAGRVFANPPAWNNTYNFGGTMWAPDISFTHNEYRMYYAVSSFGKTASAIGLAVNKTLDAGSADYRWIDRGKVIETPPRNNWNALDPCAFEDADGNCWLVLGSCWTGLKLIQLDNKTGLSADPNQKPIAMAMYPPKNIIEEGYIRRRGDYYYLWESVDYCCRGAASTYRILVGRSKDLRGPFIDRDGKPMLQGGGTLVLASYDKVRGPGSCAIIPFANHDYLIHHEYDANNRGTPTLQIRQLFWADDGWPVAGEPIVRSPAEKPPASKPITGDWAIRTDFANGHPITLSDDGTLSPAPGIWKLTGNNLTLSWTKAAKTLSEQYNVADDGSFFVGRNTDGIIVTGTRNTSHTTQ